MITRRFVLRICIENQKSKGTIEVLKSIGSDEICVTALIFLHSNVYFSSIYFLF